MLSDEDRARLQAIVDDRNRPLKHVQRARIILLSADRLPVLEVAERAGVSRPAVWRWQQRYAESGMAGLLRDKTRPPGKKPVPAATVAKVLALTCGEPPGEMTHWTGRAMAKAVGLSLRTVQRIWQANRLQPHRLRTFKRSTDPAFAEKVADVVGLYMHPPAHAVVLSIDEKSQIQALDRTQPGLPMKPGKCGTMTHDYKRHGTTTLFAALNIARWGRARPLHAAPHAPGVHPFPQRRRARGAGSASSSTPSSTTTPPTSIPRSKPGSHDQPALGLPFHPDLGILAQRRRELLLQAHPPTHPARRLPLDRRPPGRHQPLPQATQ